MYKRQILDCTVVNDKEEYVDPTVEALVKCFPAVSGSGFVREPKVLWRGPRRRSTENRAALGFKHGIPADADLVFDVRFLPNPYYIEELKPQTGNDKGVQDLSLIHI